MKRLIPILVALVIGIIIGVVVGWGGASWKVSMWMSDCEEAALLGKWNDECATTGLNAETCIELRKSQCIARCNFSL